MARQMTRRTLLAAGLAAVLVATGARAGSMPPRLAQARRLEKWRCTNQDCEPDIYDPSQGAENIADPDRPIPPGVAFEDLPDDWVCPVCGDVKAAFLPGGEWVTVPNGV